MDVEGWEVVTLEDVCAKAINGGTPSTEVEKYWEGDIPWITGADILNQKVSKIRRYITGEAVKNSSTNVIPKGNLLVVTRTGVGKLAIAPFDVAVSQDFTGIIPNEKIKTEFLFWLLNNSVNYFLDLTQGTSINGITRKDLMGFVSPIPPLPEQHHIAEILSTVDWAIEQTEAIIAKQQRIKTGLMQDLLTRGIDEHGNIRSEETHEFKDSPMGRIPMEWEVERLRESSEVCNSFRKPIAALVRENMKGDYPYYGPTGILDYIDEYRVDGKFVLIGEDGDHFLKFKTQEMTLLVEGKGNVNNHAHILRGKGNVLTEWLHLFFLHRDITLHLTRQGAGRFKLNKAALLELLLSVPKEPAEQERILKVMNTLRQNQIRTIDNLNKLKSNKTALMQDLLTGKKRVTTLLENIP